jgi:type IV pilus assembly protein PilB
VVVGGTRTDDVFLLDEIRHRLKVQSVKLVLIPAYDVRGALEIIGQGKYEEVDLSAILAEVGGVGEQDVQVEKSHDQSVDLEKVASESPVIRYVNYIIQTAIKENASDIHIEPAEKKLKVRFRIDGELYEMMNPPASMASAITSRLKIMANLDISERRIPQDGRVRCIVQGRKLDLRMSTLPCGGGHEKTVLRILDTKSINVQLEDLGFHEDTLTMWKKLVDAPHGIVLVTGPTGSGKTTTLYSSLRQLDKNSMNISTVEDPIEYHLDGITQTQVFDKIHMTFSVALRALLRQDPDVIMLGENPRPRDRGHRRPGRPHRPPRALHAAHQRRPLLADATGEHRAGAVPGGRSRERRAGPAAGAPPVRPLQGPGEARRRAGRVPDDAGAGPRPDLGS